MKVSRKPIHHCCHCGNCSPRRRCHCCRVAVVGPRKLGMMIIAALVGWRKQHGISFEISAIARHDTLKEIIVERLGADLFIDTRKEQPRDRSYDIVFDTTGTASGFELSLRLAKQGIFLFLSPMFFPSLSSVSSDTLFCCCHVTCTRVINSCASQVYKWQSCIWSAVSHPDGCRGNFACSFLCSIFGLEVAGGKGVPQKCKYFCITAC